MISKFLYLICMVPDNRRKAMSGEKNRNGSSRSLWTTLLHIPEFCTSGHFWPIWAHQGMPKAVLSNWNRHIPAFSDKDADRCHLPISIIFLPACCNAATPSLPCNTLMRIEIRQQDVNSPNPVTAGLRNHRETGQTGIEASCTVR